MSTFRSDLFVRLMDVAEKQVPAKLKPIVVIALLLAGYAVICALSMVGCVVLALHHLRHGECC